MPIADKKSLRQIKERTNNQILMTIVLTNDLKFVIITLKVRYALGSFHSL